ncbi:putative bifunctional diguanylate cyclase/phosphodiesterase [Novosphingobium sp.]|uniref:putative bifunctional diguanylate cyclase/phosphodiesterase n=1 Tax=Novosphingobium sp. TaxID=1874826 RepID=UPI003D0FF8CC
MRPDDVGQVAFDWFQAQPGCMLLAVADAQARPVGQLERTSFLLRFGSQYGNAIYARRPVSLTMEPVNLMIEADDDAVEFAERALDLFADELWRGFIIVDQGRYLGVSGMIELLRATTQERTSNARKLRGLADDLRKSNRALERQRRLAEAVIEHIPSLIAVRGQRDGTLRLINRAGAEMMGKLNEKVMRRSAVASRPGDMMQQILRADATLARQPPAMPCDLTFTIPGAMQQRIIRAMQIRIPMPDDDALTLTIAEDVTEVRRATSRIEELALFDVLTGLPNRVQLNNRLISLLDTEVSGAMARPEVALIAIDLDRFKMVNDTFGHDAGDMVLREMAARLRLAVRPEDLSVRIGGDEFAVLVSAPSLATLSEIVAQRLCESMKQPFHIRDKIVHLGGSIGIAIYPHDCRNADELMKHADMAMYDAKANGKGTWRRFSPGMREGLEQRSALEMELRQALARGQLAIHLQPQMDIADRRISGFECLARWTHPDLGQVPPAVFIPLAEDIGLIGELGEWIIQQSCRIGRTLPAGMSIAVNVSAVQFRLPGLVECIQAALADSGLEADRLELEVTESMLIADEAQVMISFNRLKALGVRIALDDFGTGFASFTYLKRYAFDKIKIDRSFVSGLPQDASSRAIVSAVAVLGSQLGAVVTAEGVETNVQYEALERLGCMQVQGYLIGRPSADPYQYLQPPYGQKRMA